MPPQFIKGLLFDLPYAFARDTQELGSFFQCMRLAVTLYLICVHVHYLIPCYRPWMRKTASWLDIASSSFPVRQRET